MVNRIGEVAGKIWHYLNEQGETSLSKLKAELKERERLFFMAIGWLARENNLGFRENDKKRGLRVYLKKTE